MWFRQEASYILSETEGQRAAPLRGAGLTPKACDLFLALSGVAG